VFGRPRSLATALSILFGVVTGAVAQTNERAYENIEFRVVTPGARAEAMGRTFIGIADDATAAASNPAGLSNLADPEVSFEWSLTDLQHTRMASFVPNRVKPVRTITTSTVVQEPTFFSLVSPLPDRRGIRNATVAVFYSSLQRYQEQFDIPNELDGERLTQGGYAGEIDISARSLGLAGSVVLGQHVSIGGALTARQLSNRTKSGGYVQDSRPERWEDFRSGTNTDGTDTKLSGQIGVLIKLAGGFSAGASYIAGTTFELKTQIFGVFSPENSPPLPPRDISTFMSPEQNIEYRIPDRLTAGAAMRASPAVTVVGDLSLVRYSQRITDRFLIVDFLGQPSAGLDRSQYVFHDALEVHFGGEYRRPMSFGTLAFRAGFFTDPPHHMRFDERYLNPSRQAVGQRLQFNAYHRGTVIGKTFGGGIVLWNRFQVDAAVSVSSAATGVVVSSVYRFPR
jgi:long-chain fatty acid transport protein